MTNTKKEVAIVLGITKNYVFALANTLIGLTRHNKKFWSDIIVFHDGISEEEKNALNNIVPIRFIDASNLDSFKKIKSSNIKTLKKYSIAAFYRYECLNLLDEYKKVIWTDVDVLIRDDISKICDYAEKTGIAIVQAMDEFATASSLYKIIPEYDMFCPLWNDGIMVLSDKLKDYKKAYEWCFDATIKYQEKLLWPDLAIINLMAQEFSYDVEKIDSDKFECHITNKKVKSAYLIHAYGEKKFWNSVDLMNQFPEWQENAIKWGKILSKEYAGSPKISCVMSTYERYDFLEDSVNSILAQSYPNFELIVVLEKSKNQSKIESILKSFNDSRIVIIKNKEKLGFPASLNVGIDSAKGEYIARMDDDDISVVTRFMEEKDFLDKHPSVGIVGSKVEVFGRDKGIIYAHEDTVMNRAQTLVGTPFMHPTVMMRKSMLDKNNLRYDPDYFTEDYELWSRAVYCFDVANIQKILCFYRSHNLQATSGGTNNNEEKIHSSHKRIMRNQLKNQLGIELTENEIEMIQCRKDCRRYIADLEGLKSLHDSAVKKIFKANAEKQVYEDFALKAILCPLEKAPTKPEEEPKVKAVSKKIIRKLINPVYGRLVERIERNVVVPHVEDLRSQLMEQIVEKTEKNEKK